MWSLISGGVTSGYNYVSSYVAENYLGQGGASSVVELRPLRTPASRMVGGTGAEPSTGQRALAKYDPKSKFYEGTSSDRLATEEHHAAEAADDPGIEMEDISTEFFGDDPDQMPSFEDPSLDMPEFIQRGSPVTAELSGPWVHLGNLSPNPKTLEILAPLDFGAPSVPGSKSVNT